MPIAFRFLDGPQAGQTVEIPDDAARVVVGRDPAVCQVVFVGDDRRVGRQHCVLERRGAQWRLNLDGVHRVLVDELPVDDGHLLRGDCTLRISSAGPRLALTLAAAAPAAARPVPPDLETLPQAPAPAPPPPSRRARPAAAAPPPDLEPAPELPPLPARHEKVAAAVPKKGSYTMVLQRLDRSVRRNRRFALLAILLALGVAGGAGWVLFGPKPEPPPPPPPPKPKPTMQQVLNAVQPSVYLVVLRDAAGRESAQATAWAVGPALLATNAHVARLYSEKKEGETLLARSTTEPPADHPIVGVAIHPGFEAYKELWIDYMPAREAPGGRWEAMQMIPSCDVATLAVAKEAALGPALPLAPADAVGALAAGEQVGFVGFPMENLAMGGVNVTNPTPTTQIGALTAVTDFFLGRQVAADRQLVQHNLPAAGGASGSPILNGEGQVVAVLSGGNVVMAASGRIATGAGVNFAQRVDLLQELLDGRADAAQADRAGRWRAGIKQFESLRTRIMGILVEEWRQRLGADATIESYPEQQGTAATQAREQWHFAVVELTLPAAGEFLLTAVGRPELEIDVYLSRQRHDTLDEVMREGDLIDKEVDTGWFSHLGFRKGFEAEATVYAYVLIDKPGTAFRIQLHRRK